jgi:DNA-binding protein
MNEMKEINKFKDRIKELRKDKNLSQEELGKEINYTQSGVAKWESGEREPSINMLIKLARYFNVPIDYLVGNID